MISIPIYIWIAQNVLANPKYAQGLSFAKTARIALWFLVLIDLGYFIFWKRRYLTPEALLDKSQKTKLFRALQEYKGSVEERAAAVVSTYVTRKVVIFAIIEAIAVYGLVLALVGRYLLDQYLLSALSLVLLTLEFPTERSLESLLREIEGSPERTQSSKSLGDAGWNLINFRCAIFPAWSDDAGRIAVA